LENEEEDRLRPLTSKVINLRGTVKRKGEEKDFSESNKAEGRARKTHLKTQMVMKRGKSFQL